MISKTFKAKTEFDYDLNIYTITSCENSEFGKSLEIEEGIIMDFDTNDMPISIEILDISERLNLSKDEIKNSNAHMNIKSTKDILEICVTFFIKIHDSEFRQTIDSKIANNFNIPEMEFAIV